MEIQDKKLNPWKMQVVGPDGKRLAGFKPRKARLFVEAGLALAVKNGDGKKVLHVTEAGIRAMRAGESPNQLIAKQKTGATPRHSPSARAQSAVT